MNRGYAPGLIGKLILHKLTRVDSPIVIKEIAGNKWEIEISNQSMVKRYAITFEILPFADFLYPLSIFHYIA